MKSIVVFSFSLFAGGLSLSAQTQETVDSLHRVLQEAVVTAKQPVTRLSGTSLVSTIAGSRLSHLGSALDVLVQLPMIAEAEDHTVSVTGKGVPEIYIDGRPLRGNDELVQLRSENVKTVELELAPGALYGRDTKAVLKITTRRNFISGLSLSERAEVTKQRLWSANNTHDLTYRAGSWDFFATGGINRWQTLLKGVTTNTLQYEGKETVVGSMQNNKYPGMAGSVKAGVNYFSGEQSFGAYYCYNPERADFINHGADWLDEDPPLSRDIDLKIRARSHRGSMYYDRLFPSKYRLHFDGDFLKSRASHDVSTVYSSLAEEVRSSEDKDNVFAAGKIYLSLPLWKGDFAFGTQDSYTCRRIDFRMFNERVEEYIPSSFTDVRQISAAAFATWKRNWGKFSLSSGLRYEYVDYLFKVDRTTDEDISRKDNYFTPDVSLSYFFNERSQVSLSYKMSTVKPSYSQLTGNLNYVGQHQIEGGNTGLLEGRLHHVQFFGTWRDWMLQSSFSHTVNDLAFIKRLYPASTLQLLFQPVNTDISSLNLYLSWNRRVGGWSPNFTAGMYKQWMKLYGIRYNDPMFYGEWNNTVSLPWDMLATVNVQVQSKGHMNTNYFYDPSFMMNASLSKYFLGKSLQVRLSATDIFHTRKSNMNIYACGVLMDKRQSSDNRGVTLTVAYNLHPRPGKYKGEAASEDEMRRL